MNSGSSTRAPNDIIFSSGLLMVISGRAKDVLNPGLKKLAAFLFILRFGFEFLIGRFKP